MIIKNLGLGLFVATTLGMLAYALAFAESLTEAFILLVAVVGFYISIKEHTKELNGHSMAGD